MGLISDVEIEPIPLDRWRDALEPEAAQATIDLGERARRELDGVRIWNVNSTARGGGVAEMLGPLVSEARGAGVDARWAVITGDEKFFDVTKRIHNRLHGQAGDGGALGDEEREAYEAVTRRNAAELAERIRPDDVVILHDPQTAGMASELAARGAAVVWRCHVGVDTPNDHSREAWDFLLPYLRDVRFHVFSRESFVWDSLDESKIRIIHPSIDVFAAKNRDMPDEAPEGILVHSGLIEGRNGTTQFARDDGREDAVRRKMSIEQDGPVPEGTRFFTQVSRWDGLKDPVGIIRAFAQWVAPECDAHLVLAGPDVEAVSDDPEGRAMLDRCKSERSKLDASVRGRIHLAALPMDDREENAAMVNALQRRSDVVAQKSLAEGFGLTVAEAMWKGRPVIGSKVGGIQDQIVDGETGVLVDPCDLEGFAGAVTELLVDADRAERLGEAAHLRVRDEFLGPRHLAQYLELIDDLRAG